MKSFSDCLKKHGLDQFERELLTSRRDALLDGKEAADGPQAALMAVNAYESDLLDRRDAIYKAIGLEPPAREPTPQPGPSTPTPPETPKPEPEPPKPKLTVTVAQAKKHWATVLPTLDEESRTAFAEADWRMLDGAPHVIAKDGSAFHFVREEGKIIEIDGFVSAAARRRAVGKTEIENPVLLLLEAGDTEGLAKLLYEGADFSPKVEHFPQILPDLLIRMLVPLDHQSTVEANMKKHKFKISDRAQLIAPGGEVQADSITISALFNPEKGHFTDTGWMPGQLKGRTQVTPDPKEPEDVQADQILEQLAKSDLLDPQMGTGTFGSFMAREAVFFYVKTASDFLGTKFQTWATRNAPRKAIADAIRDGRIDEVKEAANFYLEHLNLLSAVMRDTETVQGVIDALRKAYFKDGGMQRNFSGDDLQSLLDQDLDATLTELATLYLENENSSDQTNRKVKVDPKVPPRLEAIIRRGQPDWRQGRNIASEQEFKDAFGFRDVEFGNWVNQVERQENLNLAFDALMDFTKILGIDPKTIGDHVRSPGALGLAFGGRGVGKASAHYEPDNHVINLTKNKGNGTVSHEWTHAAEYSLRDKSNGKQLSEGLRAALSSKLKTEQIESVARSILMSESTNSSDRNVPPRDAMLAALLTPSNLWGRISFGTQFNLDAQEMDQGAAKPYWAKKVELVARAAEAYYHDKIKGGSPYLTSPYVADGVATAKNGYLGTPYPLGEERANYTNKVIEQFLSQINWETMDAKTYEIKATLREGKDGKFYLYDQHWHLLQVEKKRADAERLRKGYDDAPVTAVLSSDRYFNGLANKEAWGIAERVDEIMKELGIAPYPEVKDGSMAESMFFHLRYGWWPSNNPQLEDFAKKAYRVDALDMVKKKRAQEDFEAALARYAGQRAVDMALQGSDHQTIYQYLVDLYNKQPNLDQRDSTSMINQGFSTPPPIAWLAALLTRAKNSDVAYDPTGGNGILVLGFNPKKVILNELEARRLANLRQMEYGTIHEGDATTVMERGLVRQQEADVVVMNPPFGAMAKDVNVDGYLMRAIDQLIVAKNMAAMKDDGRGVIIVGANKQAGLISGKDRPFLNWLYANYNVADHFEVDGDLYKRMGAAWPIRVLVIAGRQVSDRLAPETGTIDRVSTHEELWERHVQAYDRSEQVLVGTVAVPKPPGGPVDGPGPVPGGDTGKGGTTGTGPQPGGPGSNNGGLPRPGNEGGERGGSTGGPGVGPGTPPGPGNGPGGGPGVSGTGKGPGGGGGTTGGTGPRGVPGGNSGLDKLTDDELDNLLGDKPGEPEVKKGKGKTTAGPGVTKKGGTKGAALGDERKLPPPAPKPATAPKTQQEPYVAPEADRDEWDDHVSTLVKARPFLEYLRIDPANGRWHIDENRTLHFSFVRFAPPATTPKFVPAGRSTEYLVLNGMEYLDTGAYHPISGGVYQVGAIGVKGPMKMIPGTNIPETAGNVLDDLFGAKFSEGDPIDIDSAVYKQAKPAFQQMWDNLWDRLGDMMASLKAFVEQAVARWNEKIKPYLRVFVNEKRAEEKDRVLASRKRPIVTVAVDNELQSIYQGRSKGDSTGVMIPVDQAAPLARAFALAEEDLADVAPDGMDQYVMQELGYDNLEAMWYGGRAPTAGKGLGGYQVDVDGLAMLQFERGGGFINADATGVGKGRAAAGMINWAVRKGKIPVFITVDNTLYSQMVADMENIGTPHEYTMTNSDVPIINEDEEVLREGQSEDAAKDVIDHIIRTGTLPGQAKVLFTTYTQITSNSPTAPNRRPDALRALTQTGKAVYILDESHNASGASAELFLQFLTGEGIDEARFPRAADWQSPPVAYFSATFAKRPDNLPVYARTHINLLGNNVDDLKALFTAGGVPLQQVVSRMLVESGQLIRRERDLSHLDIRWKEDHANGAIHKRLFDQVTDVLRSVVHTDTAVKAYMKDKKWAQGFIDDLIQAGLLPAGATSGMKVADIAGGLGRVDFMSVVHNYLAQLLLAVKIDSVVAETVAAVNRGEKVIIPLQNTMEAMLNDYIKPRRIKVGDPLPDFGWKSVSQRAIDNTLRIKYKEKTGFEHRIAVPLHMWPRPVQDEHARTMQKIERLKTPLPGSPIDAIIHKLRSHVIYNERDRNTGITRQVMALPADVPAGKITRPYVIEEITGRSNGVDYGTNPPTYYTRTKPKKKQVVNRFNNGATDGIVMNSSGSTGLNMHPSADYADQRPRHMIIVQAASDIAVFQQIIGRINRTWQVEYPIYTMLGTEIPAEARPMAMLRKKLKILTSNTSSSNKTAGEVEATDFINQYGSYIVAQYLREHPRAMQFVGLNIPVEDEGVKEDLAHQASGRVALMQTDDQEDFYEEVTRNYIEDIRERNEAGTNRLDMHHYPFNADLLTQAEYGAGMDPSGRYPLAGPSYVGEYEVDIIGAPPSVAQVKREVAASLNGRTSRQVVAQIEADLKVAYDNAAARVTDKILEYEKSLADPNIAFKEKEATENLLATAQDELKAFRDVKDMTLVSLNQAPIGSSYLIDFNEVSAYGVIVGYQVHKSTGGNPYSPSNFKFNILRAVPQGRLSMPLTRWRVATTPGAETITQKNLNPNIDDMFVDTNVTGGRTRRHIITGNIPIAFRDLQGSGEIMTFSIRGGDPKADGLLMPLSFKPGNLAKHPYAFVTAKQAENYVLAVGHVLADRANRSDLVTQWANARNGQDVPADLPVMAQDDLKVFVRGGTIQIFPRADNVFVRLESDKAGKRWAKDKGLIAITGDFRAKSGWPYRAWISPGQVPALMAYLKARTTLHVAAALRDFGKNQDPGPVKFEHGMEWTNAETDVAGVKFSPPGVGMSTAEVESFVKAVTAQWKNAPPVVVVRKPADVGITTSPTARGLYRRGVVYLFADNLANRDAAQFVLLHETLGHYGLQGVLGAELDPMMERIYRTNPTIRRMADARRKAAKERGREMSIALSAEEALADLAGSGRWSQVSGWQMLFAAIRAALRKVGFNMALSNDEVAILLANARKYVRDGILQQNQMEAAPAFSMPRTVSGEVPQAIDSAATSRKQVPAAMKKIPWQKGTINLDIGAGRFSDATQFLKSQGVENLEFDPFNRTMDQNYDALENIAGNGGAHTVTALNVLNVVQEPSARANIIRRAAKAVSSSGVAYFQVYEGDGSGVGAPSRDGWQENRGPDTYLGEIRAHFGDVRRKGLLIEARGPKKVSGDTWQADDGGIKFSSGPMFTLAMDGPLGALKQNLQDRFFFDGKSMSWLNKTINTQFHKAETNPYYRPVYQGVQRFIADVNAFANDAADVAGENVLPRMRDLTDVAFNPFKFSNWKKERQLQRDMKAVGQVVWASTLADMRPTDPQLMTGFSAPVRNTKGDVIGSVDAPALTPEQLDHYTKIRAAIDLSLDQAAASEMVKLARENVLESTLPPIDDARKAAKDDPKNAANILIGALNERLQIIEEMYGLDQITEEQATQFHDSTQGTIDAIQKKAEAVLKLQDQGYAPLMRFGQYTVKVMVPEHRVEGMKENVLYFGMFESKKAANAMGREMLAELQEENPEAILVNGTMDTESWKQMRGLSLDTLEAFASITGIDKDEAVQDYLKMAVASRSAMKRLIHRKGIQGYDEDVQRVLATFVTSQARLAARNYHFGELVKATAAIPQEMGDVRAEASQLTGYVQNPGEEAQGIRGFLFTQFLGGSIASALTNITQPWLMTLPYLSQFHPGSGFTGALSAPTAASKALGKALLIVVGRATPDDTLAKALELAASEGITEPQEIHQLYAESIRSGLGGRNLQMRKLMRLWGATFSLSESFNRKVTFVSAFELARQPGAMQEINAKRAGQGRSEFRDAYDFAAHAVNDTQGIYNKGNRPNWARGGVGATLFTFKQFSIAYVEFLSRLPARERAIALAILVMAAGAEGLPFEDDLIDLWDTIWQALGFSSNAKKSIRKWAVQTLGEAGGGFLTQGLSGIPGSPIDVSGRLGVGNLIPGTALFARSTEDATREVAQFAGPVGSLAMSARQGIAALEEGQFKSAAYNVVPKAIRDAMQAVDMYQTGYYRDLKGRRTIQTDGVDAAFKAIGLMPHNVAQDSRARQDTQQDIALHKVVESSIADRWARGVVDNDGDEIQSALVSLREWNLKNPEMPIIISPVQIRQRVQAANQTAEQRQRKATPPELRGRELR